MYNFHENQFEKKTLYIYHIADNKDYRKWKSI